MTKHPPRWPPRSPWYKDYTVHGSVTGRLPIEPWQESMLALDYEKIELRILRYSEEMKMNVPYDEPSAPKPEPKPKFPKITIEQLATILFEFDNERRNWELTTHASSPGNSAMIMRLGREKITSFPMKDKETAQRIIAAQCLAAGLREIGLEVETIFDVHRDEVRTRTEYTKGKNR